jgi:1-deoxy-D-xylulose-5-phosphate synthase
MVVMAPKDEDELRHMIQTAIDHDTGPIAFRYPRGSGVGVSMIGEPHALPIGRGEQLRQGNDISIIAIGSTVLAATRAAEILAESGISAEVINARFVKPLDRELILASIQRTGRVLTVEEAGLAGGFGSAVLEAMTDAGLQLPVKRLGIPDRFFDHASQNALRKKAGIDASSIVEQAEALVHGRIGEPSALR